MAGVLYRLGRLCANRAALVVAVWIGLVVVVRLLVWGVGAETSNDLSLPGTESQQATDLLTSRFPPQQNGSSPVVFHVTKGKITPGPGHADPVRRRRLVAATLAGRRAAARRHRGRSPTDRRGRRSGGCAAQGVSASRG
jgi:hypothetical protein